MWHEFDFYLNEKLLELHPNSEYYDKQFHFKKSLLPILDRYDIEDFLILDEGRFFLLRVEVSAATANDLKKEFESLVSENSDFDKVAPPTIWSPEDDSRDRILGARGRAIQGGISFQDIPEGGWKIEARDGTRWIVKPDDSEMKTDKFARFMSKVVGRFTRAYLEEMSERVDDRWLLSVFIHLLLHSVSEQRFEKNTRTFPWI